MTYFDIITDDRFWSNISVWANNHLITNVTTNEDTLFYYSRFTYNTISYFSMWTNFGVFTNCRFSTNDRSRMDNYILFNLNIWTNICVVRIDNRNAIFHMSHVNTSFHNLLSLCKYDTIINSNCLFKIIC